MSTKKLRGESEYDQRQVVYLPRGLNQKLVRHAGRRMVSISAIIRQALEAHFAESERPDLAKPRLSDAD